MIGFTATRDAEIARLRAESSALTASVKALTEQNEKLLSAVLTLKLSGAESEPEYRVHDATPTIPALVQSAINDRSGRSKEIAAQLTQYALDELAREADPEVIASNIYNGGHLPD